jgi:hypothetical protein
MDIFPRRFCVSGVYTDKGKIFRLCVRKARRLAARSTAPEGSALFRMSKRERKKQPERAGCFL